MVKRKVENTKRFINRFIATVLVFVLLLQTFAWIGSFNIFAAPVHSEVTTTETVSQNGVSITTRKKLSYLGGNTFQLDITATSSIKEAFETSKRTASEDGVFIVPDEGEGWYLLELWGGRGGVGSDVDQLFLLTTYPGGSGGQSGYVYGAIYLHPGDALVYTIGTRGADRTASDQGGGVNEGGGAGDDGLGYGVGGGGGYSAVYLFRAAEHKTDASISEDERLSKYIMIAGGGGGGAAGNAYFEPQALPNGGRGGVMGISKEGDVFADPSKGLVAGTFFQGADGSSSGGDPAFDILPNWVGRGGGATPGITRETFVGWYNTPSGNDWIGTYNPSLAPGAGGNGNLRGGGGGAGFTGGSGGIMPGSLLAYNIGGGGGGASFVSDEVKWEDLSRTIMYFLNGYKNNDNETDTGGKLITTYLGKDPDTLADVSPLQNATIEGTISKYFDIDSVTVNNGEYHPTATFDKASGKVTVTGADITPDADDGFADTVNDCTVSIVFTAKTDFLGGNKTPVFAEGGNFTIQPAARDKVSYVTSDDRADYCNVPMNFVASGNSYTFTKSANQPVDVSSLYNDFYADLRTTAALRATWRADMLNSLSAYEVRNGKSTSGSKVTSATVQPTTTTNYTVMFTVTQKYAAADVGPVLPMTSTISDGAVIIIIEEGQASIDNGNAVLNTSKGLSFRDGAYYFDVSVNGSHIGSETIANLPDNRVLKDATHYTAQDGNDQRQTNHPENTLTVPFSGWYSIAVRGGKGGNGGSYSGIFNSYTGGQGALGGYVSAVIYLEKGQFLAWFVGTNGTNGAAGSSGNGGGGGVRGVYSWVCIDGTWGIVGNGGGGGSGCSCGTFSGANGRNAVRATGVSADWGHSHNGTNGSKGNNNTTPAEPGRSGYSAEEGNTPGATAQPNYGANSVGGARLYYSAHTEGGATYTPLTETQFNSYVGNSTTGAVFIDYLGASEEELSSYEKNTTTGKEYFEDLSFDVDFSRYFTVDTIYMTDNVTNKTYEVANAHPASGTATSNGFKYTASGSPDKHFKIYDLVYNGNTAYSFNGSTLSWTAEVNLTIYFRLTPTEGFLGGNDVPLLEPNKLGGADKYNTADNGAQLRLGWDNSSINFKQDNKTDFANVALNYTFDPFEFLADSPTITCGQSVDLYNLITADKMTLPTGADAWKADYVTAVLAKSSGSTKVVSPTATTQYDLHQYLRPKTATAAKAQVVSSVSELDNLLLVTVYVQYTVTTTLTNMSYTGQTIVDSGSGLETAKLTVNEGFAMPDSITVSVGGKALSNGQYQYNKETGELTIPAENVTGNITITAAAKRIPHSLSFIWQEAVGGETKHDTLENIDPGTDLTTLEFYKTHVAMSFTPPKHYMFYWDWNSEDGKPITEMPDYDVIVLGTFYPEVYKLTVHYVDDEGNSLEALGAPDYTALVPYGLSFQVPSPEVAGYVPEETSVSGVMDEDDVNYGKLLIPPEGDFDSDGNPIYGSLDVTVVYNPIKGNLHIFYVKADGSEVADSYNQVISDGTAYHVASPSVTGYTPDQAVVEGTASAEDAENGLVIYVHYTADVYEVTFNVNASDASISTDQEKRHIQYDSTYYFDPKAEGGMEGKEGAYVALPIPIRDGYKFLGWYTLPGDEEGDLVTESTVVNTVGDRTLYAHWISDTEVVSVEIEWGNLSFHVSDINWEADEHQYVGATFTPADEQNYVSVSNNGGVTVAASFSYSANAGYDEIEGNFVQDDKVSAVDGPVELAREESVKAWLTLNGQVKFTNRPDNGFTFVSGVCTVTLEERG